MRDKYCRAVFHNKWGVETHAEAVEIDFSACLAAANDHRDRSIPEHLKGRLSLFELIGVMIDQGAVQVGKNHDLFHVDNRHLVRTDVARLVNRISRESLTYAFIYNI